MFLRSFRHPRNVLTRMNIPRPSGYWGARRSIRHSGKANAPSTSTAATATGSGEFRGMYSSEPYRSPAVPCGTSRARASLRLGALGSRSPRAVRGSCRRDADVPRHLLVQRRAEVRAVERVDARFLRHPRHRARLTRLQDQLGGVLAEDREAMENVPVLLDVRDVELHRVADLHALDVVRREVAADRDHLRRARSCRRA